MKFRTYVTDISSPLIQSLLIPDTSLSVDHLNIIMDPASFQILQSNKSSVFKVTSCPEIESFVKNIPMPGTFTSLCARDRIFFSNLSCSVWKLISFAL